MSVFISYSRADNDFVDLLQRLLVSKGYDAWLDRRDIGAGSRWDNAIEQAIKARAHMIVVLSPEAADSQNVADEWNFAIEEGKTVIPIYYRACSIPMRLRRLQWIDFEKQPFGEAFKALTTALGEPDNRPSDPIQLAKRDGFVLVEIEYPLDIERTRVAYVYSDYPVVESFLNIVYMTLLRGRVKTYSYGEEWVLRDKITRQEYLGSKTGGSGKRLLHEVGIEPGAQLEVILRKGIIDEFYQSLKRN
jgi:TIR domain-containing protein